MSDSGDFRTGYDVKNKFSLLLHCSEAEGQTTTALPRFAAAQQPLSDATAATEEAMLPFLEQVFDRRQYHTATAEAGSYTWMDEAVSHYGTDNYSAEERIVVFVMFVESDMAEAEVEVADNEQSYEWVNYAKVYGEYHPQFYQAIVRNAEHNPLERIYPEGWRPYLTRQLQQYEVAGRKKKNGATWTLYDEYISRCPGWERPIRAANLHCSLNPPESFVELHQLQGFDAAIRAQHFPFFATANFLDLPSAKNHSKKKKSSLSGNNGDAVSKVKTPNLSAANRRKRPRSPSPPGRPVAHLQSLRSN